MSLSLEDLELRAFDPPHLGMPGWACQAGRWEDCGRFVEIFVAVRDGRIIDVGFLTNIPGDGLVCASAYCDEVLQKPWRKPRLCGSRTSWPYFPPPSGRMPPCRTSLESASTRV